MAGLLDNDGPLDKVFGLVAFVFTTAWFLAFGLGVSVGEDVVRNFYTLGGVVDTGGDVAFDHVHSAVASAAFALPVIGMLLPGLLGTETRESRQARQTLGFWVWLGWTIYHVKFLMSNDPYGGTTSNYIWLVNNGASAYLHYRWVGRDVRAKLKLA